MAHFFVSIAEADLTSQIIGFSGLPSIFLLLPNSSEEFLHQLKRLSCASSRSAPFSSATCAAHIGPTSSTVRNLS